MTITHQENSDELLALPLATALLEHPIPTTTVALAERVRTCYLQVTPYPVLLFLFLVRTYLVDLPGPVVTTIIVFLIIIVWALLWMLWMLL